jgi:hypothetical protein
MSTFVEQQNQANERNTAQNHMDRLVNQDTKELLVYLNLYGPVDFSAWKGKRVTRIAFKEKGGITSLRGIPSSVVVLECENQLISELGNLSPSIETLHIGKNAIRDLDLSNLSNLRILRAENCQIKTIMKLPRTLEELYINDNLIRHLDLSDTPKLRVLHCLRNKVLRIENIPPSLVDLVVEEGNPLVELNYDFIPDNSSTKQGTKAEYIESLEEYFRLKSKYEESVREMREKIKDKAVIRNLGQKNMRKWIRSAKPKCVNCRRPVGTVFRLKKGRYLAYCGDQDAPCSLKIELFRGEYLNNEHLLYLLREQVYELKESIIQQKMDTLFGYVSEDQAVDQFKKDIEAYHSDSTTFNEHMEDMNQVYYSEHRRELIKGKLQTLDDLKHAMNSVADTPEGIHQAMDIYVKEYLPEVHNLRRLNYEIVEMDYVSYSDPDSMEKALTERTATLQKLDFLTKEVPRVISFSVGEQKQEEFELEPETED